MNIKKVKIPFDKEAAKKTVLSKLGEWAIFAPMLAAGIYFLFVEDLIKATAREVSVEVIDSALVKERRQLKIMMNFIQLQDPEAFVKASKLESEN